MIPVGVATRWNPINTTSARLDAAACKVYRHAVSRAIAIERCTLPTHRVAVNPYIAGAVGLVAAVTLINLVYVACLCPLDLAPDEAHYWDWSRHLDWCYYSKGPLVAWLIRSSCVLFGTTPFAVRLPAVVCGSLLLLGMWRLTTNTFRDPKLGFWVVGLACTLPPLSAGSVLMTIDPPLLACWAWAAVAVQRRYWLTAGLLVVVGTLAKVTMLLFPGGVGLLMLARPEWRTRRFASFLLVSSLGLLPVVVWNATHDWLGVRHLLGHADNGGRANPWYSPFAFIGGQVGLLLGFWFAAWVLTVWKWRPNQVSNPNLALLWWLSAPVFGAFLLASVKTAGQPNWPAAAYVTGFVLAVGWLWRKPMGGRTWAAMILLGLACTVFLRWPNLVRPALAAVLPVPSEKNLTPVRKLDPTARLVGWKRLASAVDRIRLEEKRRTGNDPLIATMVWTVPGELGFYCDGHPVVYSFGSGLADRFSQYDVWRPNPVADAQAFAGKTFVYVGEELPPGAFDEMHRVAEVTHAEGGVPLANWTVWVCRGFRGFDPTTRDKPNRY
jgi:4-amino-4-deoxy-L-arabinose transferase-like glycosyltransferase